MAGENDLIKLYSGRILALAADIPFPHRLGDPAEFADTVLFMARNRYINGETVRLDGSVRLRAK